MANRERKSTTYDECTSGITPPISSPKVQTELDPPQLTCAGGTDPLSWSSKVQSFVKGSCRVTIGQTPQTPLQLLPIMSDTFRFYPSLTPLPPTALRGSSRIPQQFSVPGLPISDFPRKSLNFPQKIGVSGGKVWALAAWTQEGPLQDLDDSPVSVELKLITSDTQFDRILGEAQQLEESVVIVWMATWCRKCIYLKPKLEKLAAEYYPRLRFYCVDVNTVPHKLVARAAVTKMPTIQLWKDSKKQAEVIGGHKAYLVVNEVREMIENECAK